MNLIYTIDNFSFKVDIYTSGNPIPIISQPNWPNGIQWSNYAEADQWAKACILSIKDRYAPYAPSGPGTEGEEKIA